MSILVGVSLFINYKQKCHLPSFVHKILKNGYESTAHSTLPLSVDGCCNDWANYIESYDLPFSVPPFKLSGTVTFLTIPRHWNMCSDGSVIPEHGKRRSKSIRARYSIGIESKYKFEYKYGLSSDLRAPNFNFFWGNMPPDPACLRTHHHRCPPLIVRTFRRL